jgi:hypothetical protein
MRINSEFDERDALTGFFGQGPGLEYWQGNLAF